MKKILFIILFILIFVLGAAAGFFYEKFWPTKFSAQQEKTCWEQIKNRLENSGLIIPSADQGEIRSVSGEIVAINGDVISLKINQFDILSDPELDIRFVQINNSTIISRVLEGGQEAPSEKTSGQEVSAQNVDANSVGSSGSVGDPADIDKIKEAAGSMIPQFEYQNISREDLEVGDKVSVLSETDVKTQKNIKAKIITVLLVSE